MFTNSTTKENLKKDGKVKNEIKKVKGHEWVRVVEVTKNE
jgi:hypothetical protein